MANFIAFLKGVVAQGRFQRDRWQDFRYRHPAIARDLAALAFILVFVLVVSLVCAANGIPNPLFR